MCLLKQGLHKVSVEVNSEEICAGKFFHSLRLKNADVGIFGRDLRLAISEVCVTSPCFNFFISIALAKIVFSI